MAHTSRISKEEKQLIAVALLLLLLCFTAFFYGDRWFWGEDGMFSKHPRVGEITFHKNDARHKPAESLTWFTAKDEQVLHEGDSVFSGKESTTEVRLDKGGGLTVGENSMVVFREIDRMKMADLQEGNFRVAINGTVKIAVNGRVTTFEGKGSEVQVLLVGKEKRPMLKLLKGNARVKRKAGPSLAVSRMVLTPLADPDGPVPPREREVVIDPFVTKPKPPPPPSPAPVPVPEPMMEATEFPYAWRLEDLYERRAGGELVAREKTPTQVYTPIALRWAASATRNSTRLEMAATPSFEPAKRIETPDTSYTMESVLLGANFWRASYDGVHWTAPLKFLVQGVAAAPVPRASVPENPFPLVHGRAQTVLHLESDTELAGFIYQSSLDGNFSAHPEKAIQEKGSDLALSFTKPGVHHYRFRALTAKGELSPWSEPLRLDVFQPQRPPAPILATAKGDAVLGETIALEAASAEPSTAIEVLNEKGQVVRRFAGKSARWTPSSPGNYQVRAFVKNRFGQRSKPSTLAQIKVGAKPAPAIPPMLAKRDPPPERHPSAAASGSSSAHVEARPSLLLNEAYKESEVSLQGILWTIQSSQQYYQDQSSPIAMGLGLHAMHWQGSSGVEGSLKTGVLPANSAGSQTTQLKDAEVRYHYRWITGFPFSLAREFEISLFGGYELYRNSGGLFLDKYNLFKFGTAMEFPVWRRWSSGGEFVYGFGTDSSSKKEISGNFNYFLTRQWSLGFGYRVHFFDAGSVSSAPGGFLPYREGYTEGFSMLHYNY